MRRLLAPLLTLSLLSPLAACGGSGGIVLGAANDTVYATAARSGYVIHDGIGVVNVLSGPATALTVGDNHTGNRARAFVSFDLSFLPIGAEVLSAELITSQTNVVGDPYTHLGNLMVDHVNLGASLDGADYAIGNNFALNIAVLSTTPTLELKSADVTNEVRDDLDLGRTESEFRLRFVVPTANPGQADFIQMEGAAELTPVAPPRLRITWQ